MVLGNDDPKSQDERESDGGDGGSPASHDHHNHQHPFKEGNEESEKRDPSPVQSFDSENKPADEVSRELDGTPKLGVEDDGAVNVERELKSEEDAGSQKISIEHVEFVKESHGGSSSSSSSDNESQVVEKTSKKVSDTSCDEENKLAYSFSKELIPGTEKAFFGESDNSVVKIDPVGHSVNSEEVIPVTQGDLVEKSVVSDVVESRLREHEESKRNEEEVSPLSENGGPSLTVEETVANENEAKILPTSVAPSETSNGAESMRDSKNPDSSENQVLALLLFN